MEQVDIKDFENYQITDDGKIWSKNKNKYLKPGITNSGYYYVVLSKNKTKKNKYIHKLVAEAFIPNPNNYLEINHKDECKMNNSVENLEWCTHLYNINYGDRTKKTGKKVYQYELDGTLVATYSSIMDAEKLNPTFDHSRISKCCKGKNKTHKGYKWSYKPL